MKLNELKVLVTGGAGFIGSHICDYLIEHNAEKVIVIDNLSTGSMQNIDHLISKPNFEFYKGDITNMDDCEYVVSKCNIICHQAALGSIPRSIENPLNTHNSNVNGFLNILEAAKKYNINRIVFASSSSVYGDVSDLLKKETTIGNQLSPYAITKCIDELYARIYTLVYSLETIGLRYFNVFGGRQNPYGPYAAVIPKFIDAIHNNKTVTINGDGSFSRDFTYVDNVVQANINALLTDNSQCFGQIFNVGMGNSTTILELFNLIKNEIGNDIKPQFGPIRKGDVPNSMADITKAKTILNYNPTVGLKEGIIQTIKYNITNIDE